MFLINGEEWKIFLVPPNHPELFSESTLTFALGCCNTDAKTIYLSDDIQTQYLKKVLCHELVHACMYSYKVDLTYEQEEVIADLIATYGQEIISVTNSIFVRLKQNRGAFY